MGKGSAKTQVVDYRLSVHFGGCLGPIDAVTRIRIGEKDIGIAEQTDNVVLDIDNKDLFGGPKKGGGVLGRIWLMFGKPDQVMPEELALKHGRTSDSMTGYRGFFSMFFTGPVDTLEGFTFGAQNPVVPSVDVTVRCAPKTLDVDTSMIGDDANPAHIIHECLRDPDFGVGYGASSVNDDTFLSSAETLFDEEMGLSYIWLTTTPIEQFVNEVLNTISGNLAFNLSSGKWELKLLRGDYQEHLLREINPSNARLTNFQRKGWGETINELIVTWNNPESEADETVTVHDNANMEIQGTTVSDSSRNYPGIRNGDLALRVAERELRQSSAPLAAAEVEVERSLWTHKPGDVIKFRWPERGITEPMIMRIVRADYGSKSRSTMNFSLLEDIFSFGVPLTAAQQPEPIDVDQDPIDVPYVLIETAPYFLLASTMGDADAAALAYPAVRSWLLASTGLTDIRDIDVLAEVTDPASGTEFRDVSTVDELGRFLLSAPLAREIISTITRPVGYFRGLTTGGFILFTDPVDPSIQELALVTGIAGLNIGIRRGVLDTVPQAWPSGTIVWLMDRDSRMVDATERAAGEEPEYKFLPITSVSRLAEADATTRTAELSERSYLPLRPANITVDSQTVNVEFDHTGATVPTTWSRRNRLTETSIVLSWNDSDVTPEVGQTTTIKIYDSSPALLTTLTGLTGTSRAITAAELGNPVRGDIRHLVFSSERAGYESLQSYSITMTAVGRVVVDEVTGNRVIDEVSGARVVEEP